jgi:hypothetical protein
MPRITNDERSFIVSRAMEETFSQRELRLKKESNALAELAYDRIYPADEQRKMMELPAEYFHQQSTIYLYLPGKNKNDISVQLLSSRRIAAIDNTWKQPFWKIESENAISKRVAKYESDLNQLKLDRGTLKGELTSFLRQITTTNKLQELWPEGLAYYKKIIPEPTVNVPAIIPDIINKMMLEMKE